MYHSMTLYPYLRVLRKEVYVKALIREIRRLADGSETFSPALFTLYRELGSRINEKFEVTKETSQFFFLKRSVFFFFFHKFIKKFI